MKFGDVARSTGLKVETIHFYEGEGLIKPPRRSGGNYRLYDQAQLDPLSFISGHVIWVLRWTRCEASCTSRTIHRDRAIRWTR